MNSKISLKRKILYFSFLLLAICVCIAMVLYFSKKKTNTQTSYDSTIEINIVIPGTVASSEELTPAQEAFLDTVKEWEDAHETVKVNKIKSERFQNEYSPSYLNGLELPDLFFIKSTHLSQWVNTGLLLDITDYIYSSPYISEYDLEYFGAFSQNEASYAFPALDSTAGVIVYNKDAFLEAGFSEFPDGLEELSNSAPSFQKLGFDGILALGNSDGDPYFSLIVNPFLADEARGEWLLDLVNRNKTSTLYEAEILQKISEAKELTANGLLAGNYNEASFDSALESFLSGKTAGIICYSQQASELFCSLTDETSSLYQPELIDKLGVCAIPGAVTNTGSVRGMSYGIALNSSLTSDPDKLKLALDLCEYVTGPKYAEKLKALTGLGSLCRTNENSSSSLKDELYNKIYCEGETIPLLTTYMSQSIWNSLSTDLHTHMLQGTITIKQACYHAQNAYEKDYLNSSLTGHVF